MVLEVGMVDKQETQSIIDRGKQVTISRGSIGVLEGIYEGLENLPWGCRHWGRVLGHLKGPTCWNIPTHTVGR